jgi:hypothetical protein
MNTDKYNKAAYRLTVWKEAARLLREAYFPEEGSPPDLMCDQVFRAPREVPTEVIQEVLVALNKAERSEETAMMKFRLEEMTDDQVRTLAEEPPTREESPVQAAAPQTRSKPKAARKSARRS